MPSGTTNFILFELSKRAHTWISAAAILTKLSWLSNFPEHISSFSSILKEMIKILKELKLRGKGYFEMSPFSE